MRKKISSEQYEKVYGPLNASMEELNKDQQKNRRIMRKVMSKYSSMIPQEDLESIALEALWRCLSYHEEGKNKSFTSNLWTFVKWECERELRRRRKKTGETSTISINGFSDFNLPKECSNEDIAHVRECINLLPEFDKKLVTEYFIEKRTMKEIGEIHNFSKETARQNIKKALVKFKEIYSSQ
jgi:RNA polymerase sigma factor (sigma-70 family)